MRSCLKMMRHFTACAPKIKQRILSASRNGSDGVPLCTRGNERQHSAGVILLSQLASFHEAIEALLLVWEASIPEEWIDRLEFLPWK